MSEFMGLIHGDYDAKSGKGFQPAGASLHNIMSAHGPDATTHDKASNAELKPAKVGEVSGFEVCFCCFIFSQSYFHTLHFHPLFSYLLFLDSVSRRFNLRSNSLAERGP